METLWIRSTKMANNKQNYEEVKRNKGNNKEKLNLSCFAVEALVDSLPLKGSACLVQCRNTVVEQPMILDGFGSSVWVLQNKQIL